MRRVSVLLALFLSVLTLSVFVACGDEDDPQDDEYWDAWDAWQDEQATASTSSLRVVSWNLRHEGWSGETNYNLDAKQVWNQFGSSSNSPNGCDLVFFQEVMSAAAADGIADELSILSGVEWVAITTAPIGRSTYRESYSVLYRTDRVSIVNWSVWADTGDKFEREPMIVKVRDVRSSADYTFINWHAIFGTTSERKAEIAQISKVFSQVQSADATDQDVILLGDFNASATSSWWSALTLLNPAVSWKVNDLTTLNSSGTYASAYDHFWFQSAYVTEYSSSGRDYVSNTQSFVTTLSDHVPIWLKLYSSSDTD